MNAGVRVVAEVDARVASLLELRDRIDEELRLLAKITPRQRRSRYDIPPCGTETAYQRHRYLGDEQDEACKSAHRIHNRLREAERRSA